MVVLRESGEVESDEPIEESSFEELNSSYSPPPTTHSPPRGPANFPDFPPSPTYFPVSPTSFPPSPPYFPASSPPPSSSTSSRVGVRTGLALEDIHLTLFVEYQIEERGGELNVINGLEGGLEGSALNVINELEGGALNVINGLDARILDAYEELLDEYDELEHQHEDIVDQLVLEHVGVDHRVMGYRGGQLRLISAGRVSTVNGVEYRQGQALSTTSEPSVEFEAKLSVRLWLGDRGQWVIDIHYGWKWLNLGTFRTTEGAPLAAESVGRRRGGKDLFDYPRPFLIENGSEPLQLLPTAQEENQDDGIGCEETEDCAVADQAQFNFGCLEKGITREKNPGEERRNKKANGVRIAIPLDDILQAKEMCLKDAANHLKVSTSELKSSCREHGIPKWPPRNEHKLIRQSLPKETPAVVNQMGIPQLTSHIVPSNQALTATIDTNSVVEKKIPPPQFLPTAQQENFDVGFGNDEVEAIGVGVEGTWEAVMEEAQLNSGGFGNDEAETIGVGIEGTWEAVMEEAQLNSGGFDNDEAETIGVGIEGTLEAVMEEAQLNSRGFGNDKAKTIGVGIEGTSEAVMEEAQLNSGCSGKKRKRKVNTPGGESGNNITTGVRITIPKEDILQTKGMRIEDAAKHLEVSKSTLKRICRGYGIDRWPPRKEQELINQSRPNKSPAVVDQEQIPQLNPDTLLPSNQVPANSDKYSVKVKCGEGTIIKFRLSSPWRKVELEQEVKKRLPFEAGTYDIKYRDEDDELILISCDEDLVECISSSSAVGSRSIELFLKLK